MLMLGAWRLKGDNWPPHGMRRLHPVPRDQLQN